MKTTRTKAGEIERKWYIVDAADKRLGRLASFVTKYLMGKNKVTYSPDVDNGDGVIINFFLSNNHHPWCFFKLCVFDLTRNWIR